MASDLKPPSAAGISVDAVNVEMLASLVGKEPAVLMDFLHAFQVDAAEIAQTLRKACTGLDAEQTGRQAHKLKSSAQMVGAQALAGLCGEMELAGRARDMPTLTRLLPAFENTLAAVDTFLDGMPR